MRPLSIVHTENSCGWGGQEIRILTEAQGMQRRGHRVTLITPPEAPIAAAGRRMGIEVVPLPIQKKRLPALRALRRWLHEHQPYVDVVNTHSSTDSWLSALACATIPRAPPIVRTRHVSTTVHNRIGTRWLYVHAIAHIVTTGEALRRQLARDNHVPLERMTSVPTGIDLERFVPGDPIVARARLGLPNRLTLGIVATLRDWKGHKYLFEAIARNRAAWRGWQFVVVGDGPYRDRLDARLALLGLTEEIRFVGQQDNVAPWLQALDLFTLPSYGEEGVPQSIMQAMACGIPVVSTPVGAIGEAVDDRVTGLLVAPRSVEALDAGLAALRDDPAMRLRFGAAAHERAQRDFGIDPMLDRMEAIFRAVRESADMCGIAGYFGGRVLAPAASERMIAALRQRGPDAEHSVSWTKDLERTEGAAPNALLHTRLSIIDPRPEADQPMANDHGDVWIAYNGEVYDWAADAATLKGAGYQFRTRSDTEFILHAYEHWGIECLERLRGMFALAIVDLTKRAIYVARDRLGLKPVVYSHRDDGFAFASTVRSLLPWLPRDARGFAADGIDAYLAHRTIPAPRTVFRHVSRLPPAHYLHYDLRSGRLGTYEYWRPSPSADAWLPTFDAAIRMRTVADRPLGLFLSSGIDSSAIACRLAAMGFNRLQSFTAAFPGTSFDESGEARLAAERLGFPNLAVDIPQSVADDFPRIIADLDEPFADPSSVPTWYLSRETTRHVKVVLGGDGGDELFGGYKRYAKHMRTRWRRGLVQRSWAAPAAIGGRGWQRVVEELRLDWRSAYALRFSGMTPGERAFLAPASAPQPHYWRMPADDGRDDLGTLLEIDRLNYLPDYILRKADLTTMAHGLEMRAPFLDHRFVAAVMGLPDTTRFTTPPKLALAPAVAPLADREPFTRKKRGFNPPVAGWLEGDLAPRLPGLGERLAAATSRQLLAARVDAYVAAWRNGGSRLGEQILQLIVLDESLAQLAVLAAVD